MAYSRGIGTAGAFRVHIVLAPVFETDFERQIQPNAPTRGGGSVLRELQRHLSSNTSAYGPPERTRTADLHEWGTRACSAAWRSGRWEEPLMRGFIIRVMRPMMRPGQSSSGRPPDQPATTAKPVSPQVGGFIISRCGAHDDGTGSIGIREPQMNRNTELRLLESRASSPRTTARHTDGHRTPAPHHPTASERSWPTINPVAPEGRGPEAG